MHDVPLIMNIAMASYVKAATDTTGLCAQKWKDFMVYMGMKRRMSMDIVYIL